MTVHLKVLSNTMEFLKKSYLLYLVTEFCLLFLGLGYFHGANNSFRFLSLCLKMALNIFAGNNSLREALLGRRNRCYLIIPSILGKLGL